MKFQLQQYYINRRKGWLCQLEGKRRDERQQLFLRIKVVRQARTIEVPSHTFNRDYEVFKSARKIVRCKNRYETRKEKKRRRREREERGA